MKYHPNIAQLPVEPANGAPVTSSPCAGGMNTGFTMHCPPFRSWQVDIFAKETAISVRASEVMEAWTLYAHACENYHYATLLPQPASTW